MNPDKHKIAAMVREGRAAKGFTQQELSDLTGISLRSVQRIESGEVVPRAYTLRLLSEKLGFANILATTLNNKPEKPPEVSRLNTKVRWILTLGIGGFLVLATTAFIFQSPTFPETAFEGLTLWTIVLVVYTAVLYRIWK